MKTSKKKTGYSKGISLHGLSAVQRKQIVSVASGHSRDYVRTMVIAMRRGMSYVGASLLARRNCIV